MEFFSSRSLIQENLAVLWFYILKFPRLLSEWIGMDGGGTLQTSPHISWILLPICCRCSKQTCPATWPTIPHSAPARWNHFIFPHFTLVPNNYTILCPSKYPNLFCFRILMSTIKNKLKSANSVEIGQGCVYSQDKIIFTSIINLNG